MLLMGAHIYIAEFHIVNISVERERSMMEDTLLDILIKE